MELELAKRLKTSKPLCSLIGDSNDVSQAFSIVETFNSSVTSENDCNMFVYKINIEEAARTKTRLPESKIYCLFYGMLYCKWY